MLFTLRHPRRIRPLVHAWALCALSVGLTGVTSAQSILVECDDPAVAEAFAKTATAQALSRGDGHPAPRVYRLRASGAQHMLLVEGEGAELAAWAAKPGVREARPLRGRLTSRDRTPDDPDYPEQWNMPAVNAPAAWDYTTGGLSPSGFRPVVAVIEIEGFDQDHPELAERWWTNRGEIPGNGIDDDGNGYVDDVRGWNFLADGPDLDPAAHGTHVAGVIAAAGDNGRQVSGMMWDGRIAGFQIFESVAWWILALDYVTYERELFNRSGGAEGAYFVAVNMSFGVDGQPCSAFEDVVEPLRRAVAAGILPVASAGNVASDNDAVPETPSSCPVDELVVVTGFDRSGRLGAAMNFGARTVDLAAPSERFRSVAYVENGQVDDEFNDTSGAAPHVSGAVGLLYTAGCAGLDQLALADPLAAVRLVRSVLLNSVSPEPSLDGATASGGRLDAGAAVEALLLDNCPREEVIVQLADAAADVPVAFGLDGGADASYARTLDAELGLHLYVVSGAEAAASAVALARDARVLGAEPNVRLALRSGRVPTDPAHPAQEAWSSLLGLPRAWGQAYGETAAPPAAPFVTAVFDQNFDLDGADVEGRLYANAGELAGNQLDDDGNGYVDDVSGVNLASRSAGFSPGTHGTAMLNLVGATPDNGRGIAGVDWAGRLLPIQGSTLADWLEGASYVRGLRSRYNDSGGRDGAAVVTYLTPQGGLRARVGDLGVDAIEVALDALLAEGVLTVGSVALAEVTAASFPGGIEHDGLLRVVAAEGIPFGAPPLGLAGRGYAMPTRGLAYGGDAVSALTISGTSGGAALLAGAASLTLQLDCHDDPAAAMAVSPEAFARDLRDRLGESFARVRDTLAPTLSLELVADGYAAECERSDACRVSAVGPNPATRTVEGAFAVLRSARGGSACPLQIVDALGRVVFETSVELSPEGGTRVALPASRLPAGLYVLRAGTGDGAEARAWMIH